VAKEIIEKHGSFTEMKLEITPMARPASCHLGNIKIRAGSISTELFIFLAYMKMSSSTDEKETSGVRSRSPTRSGRPISGHIGVLGLFV
jgi:hypothetical protein